MWHWRNTFKPARFFIIDARASYFVLLFLVYMRIWTALIVFAVFAILFFVERLGYDFNSSIRAARQYFAGNIRPSRNRHKETYPVDYDRIHFKK